MPYATEVGSVEELVGVAPMQLPALRQLHTLNQRVWTFVTCFVQTRRINTLYECFQAFLAQEGVRDFHELRIGNSFLHTEAVQALYHAPTAMLNVSTRDILTHLRQFEAILGHDAFRNSSHIDRTQFLQYLSQQYRQPNVETLGISIDPAGFGVYIALLRRLANQEMKEMKALEHEFQRGIAEKVFELTKEKFSAENRKQALDELLSTHLLTAGSSEQLETAGASSDRWKKHSGPGTSTTASLSLEMLKRVTDIDVYLDNVLRRKAAAGARTNQKPISSQEIAETDLKIRNQLTRFLMATQKSKHHSRIKVVTWVLCGIMAKIHSLLLHDDKLPDERTRGGIEEEEDDDESGQNKRKRLDEDGDAESDDECDCCCVGKDTCKCSCECECHSNSSDEDEETENGDKPVTAGGGKPAKAAKVVGAAAEPKAARPVDMNVVKQEVAQYLTTYCESNEIESLEQLLMCFISLEIHLQHTSSGHLDRSALELVLDLWNDGADKDTVWYQSFERLLDESQGSSRSSSQSVADREEVTRFIQQCYSALNSTVPSVRMSKSEMLQLLVTRARVEFGYDTIKGLGGGEAMATLVEEVTQPQSTGEHRLVKYSSALLPVGELQSDASSESPGESLRSKRTEEAIDALRQSPYLVDVAQCTQWQQRFAPSCGSLRSFLRTHEMILLDHASLMFLFCWNGVVVRVDESSTPSALELLISGADSNDTRSSSRTLPPPASDVAVHLVSMLAKCGGQQNYPKQLLQAHLRQLFSLVNKATKADALALERYVLDILLVVPVELADFVYAVIAGGAATGGGERAAARDKFADRVWDACRSDVERRVLASIAESSSTSNSSMIWADKLRAHVQGNRGSSATEVVRIVDTSVSSDTGMRSSILASPSTEADLEIQETIADRFNRVVREQQEPREQLAVGESDATSQALEVVQPESCRACIDQIRKEQFGIGLEIQDEATSAVLAIQQQRLERALKRLSDELYSENTHFVLELLQNADDNDYSANVRAKGEFTLTTDRQVVFYNNERGFSRANIQAICDVGASTKSSRDSSASIGKKGIGFKSVFKISDSPEVHSNGFHLRFHAKNEAHGGGLGYILPFWIEAESEWRLQQGTTFVLPLNHSSAQHIDEISESLMTFEPSILLFLRRIQELRISDQVHSQKLHFLKEEVTRNSGHQIVRLFSQVRSRITGSAASATDRAVVSQQEWLVVKTRLEAPSVFSGEDDQVRETELAIALPLDGSDDGDRAPLQQVFAYLPLRSYGFRFVIQGDFEVPSSREAIVNGSEWNQWLVSQIPKLMGLVVACFVDELQQTSGNVVSRIAHLLSLLPFESEIQAPFRSIVRDAMREVSQTPFLPAESASSSLELVKPMELLDAWEAVQDDEVLDVLVRDEALLGSTLKKKLLLVELSKVLQPQQKSLLRVEKLKASHVLQLLVHAAAKNDAQWVVDVLRVLGRLWKKDRHADLLVQELRLIKCFPLESEEATATWVSLADVGDALFLASASETERASGASSTFYDDLNVLRNDFSVAVNKTADVRAFLIAHVKVKTIEDHDLIAHHILPKVVLLEGSLGAAREAAVDDLSAATLRTQLSRYSRFIASHLLQCTADCSVKGAIRASMRVWTCAEQLVPAATTSNVYVLLPSAVKELPDLSRWLRERVQESGSSLESFDVVAFDSLDTAEGGEDAFKKLFIETLSLPVLLDVVDTRATLAFKHVLQWLQAEANSKAKERLSEELAQYLNKHWPTTTGANQSESIGDTGTQVVDLLRKSKWLSGSDGRLHRPSKLWIPTPAFKALLADAAIPYSRVSWTNEHFASEILRLKQTPTLDDALDALVRLARQEGQTSELSDVRRIYTFLSEQVERASSSVAQTIKQAFNEHPLVFAPRSGSKGGCGFFAVKDVVWSATSCASHLVPLEQSYPKTLRLFFTEVCGVERKPSIDSLCEHLVQTKAFPCQQDAKKKWKREVLPVLQFFAKQIKKAALPKHELRRIRKTLKATPWMPTVSTASSSSASWCSSKDAPIVCESDEELEVQKLVTSLRKECGTSLQSESVQLVKLDPGLLEELEPLVKLAKIRSLSVHAVSHPSVWCDLVVEAVSAFGSAGGTLATASSSSRKHVHKLLKRLVVIWAKAFALNPSVWIKTDTHFQAKLQQSTVFPTLREDVAQFVKPTDMFINDQTELAKESFSAGLQPALPILSLFPWSYFVDAEKNSGDAAQVRDFLLSFCGVQSLKAQLVFEVSVLGSHQRECALLRATIQQSLSVAQRFLFHHHREVYDLLPHMEILKLARDVRCVVLHDAGALHVVYRVGASFIVRQPLSSCYLDTKASVLYVVADSDTSEDEWRGRLHEVLMEVCRKCFGSQLAASVANLLYLASMQPSAELMEKWLVDTQLLAPIDPNEAGALWASLSSSADSSPSAPQTAKKRSFSSLEDGEVEEDQDMKRVRSGAGQQWTTPSSSSSAIFPPLPPSDGPSNRQSTGVFPPPPPPLPPGGLTGGLVTPPLPGASHHFSQQQQQLIPGGPFQPPLPPQPSGAGPDQVIRAGNAMSKEERAGIGRWGEQFVFKQLVESHKDNTDVTVEWVNEHEESGKPYDITVSARGKVVEYVEVKATRTMEKAVFEISMNELDQAAIHGSSYCIYRVFNAGNDALCRVVRMKNPVALVRQKKMQLALVMQ